MRIRDLLAVGNPVFETPALIDVGVYNTFSGTTLLVAPATVQPAGTVLILGIGGTVSSGASTDITVPGFTLINKQVGGVYLGLFYRVLTGSDPVNYTITISGATINNCVARVFQFSGLDGSNLIAGTRTVASAVTNSGGTSAFSMAQPGVYFSALTKHTNIDWVASWGQGGGVTYPNSNRSMAAYKIITNSDGLSETSGWASSTGASVTRQIELVMLRAKAA